MNDLLINENAYFTITYGFTESQLLYFTEVIYLNPISKKPYMCYTLVIDFQKNIETSYRFINSKGQYSLEAFDSYEDCLKNFF